MRDDVDVPGAVRDGPLAAFAEILAYADVVPAEALDRARADPAFAERLLRCRGNQQLLRALLHAPGPPPPASSPALALGFVTALARWASDGMEALAPEIIAERLATCMACPDLADTPDRGLYRLTMRGGHTCNRCGCVVEHKTRLNTESCPAGLWGAVPSDLRGDA